MRPCAKRADYNARMATRPKRPRDISQLAAFIVRESVGESSAPPAPTKNQAAVDLGRLGGLKGGKARASKLSTARKRAIAKKAAKARWAKSVPKG